MNRRSFLLSLLSAPFVPVAVVEANEGSVGLADRQPPVAEAQSRTARAVVRSRDGRIVIDFAAGAIEVFA
ncbi:hypothetical protein [Sinorhizobium meliloti]|uniref:hypothetical protein n=1 Tax=Rhizobium meliloti TaxID=382 RepID=UPI003F1898A0